MRIILTSKVPHTYGVINRLHGCAECVLFGTSTRNQSGSQSAAHMTAGPGVVSLNSTFVGIDQEIFSIVILPQPLIQE